MVPCNQEHRQGGRARRGQDAGRRDDAEPQGGRNGGLSAGESGVAHAARRPHGAAGRPRHVQPHHHRRGAEGGEEGVGGRHQEGEPAFPRVETDARSPRQGDVQTRGEPCLEEEVKSARATRFWQMSISFSRDAHLIYHEMLNS